VFSVSCVTDKSYEVFRDREDYRQTMDVYLNEKRVAKAVNTKKDKVLLVDLKQQRVKLLQDGWVALDIPCCTGKPGKETPTGKYKIMEKVEDKRSNIFGQLFDVEGNLLHGGDRRKYEGEYESYVGYSLPFWMRLNNDGIGLHQSKSVHRKPSSNGCIRLPKDAVAELFVAVDEGTRVKVKKSTPSHDKKWFLFSDLFGR